MPSQSTPESISHTTALALVQIKAIIDTLHSIPAPHKEYLLGPNPHLTAPIPECTKRKQHGLLGELIWPEQGKRPVVEATATITSTPDTSGTRQYTLSISYAFQTISATDTHTTRPIEQYMHFDVTYNNEQVREGCVPLPMGCKDLLYEMESHGSDVEESGGADGKGVCVPKGLDIKIKVRRAKY